MGYSATHQNISHNPLVVRTYCLRNPEISHILTAMMMEYTFKYYIHKRFTINFNMNCSPELEFEWCNSLQSCMEARSLGYNS